MYRAHGVKDCKEKDKKRCQILRKWRTFQYGCLCNRRTQTKDSNPLLVKICLKKGESNVCAVWHTVDYLIERFKGPSRTIESTESGMLGSALWNKPLYVLKKFRCYFQFLLFKVLIQFMHMIILCIIVLVSRPVQETKFFFPIRINSALYQKIETYSPRNETARPRSQFLHSCIWERFIPRQSS